MKNALFLFIFIPLFLPAQQLELPRPTGGEIEKYAGFTLEYNEQTEQAKWVAYELTRMEVRGSVDRTDNFKADPNISTGSADLSDYKKSGYDRGHLAPAGDMKWSREAMNESFFMSNMSPQLPAFNRGIWKKLEEQVREWAVDNDKILVVTGPIITKGYETIGENEVAIPAFYYKVILDITEPNIKGIGFILPNKKVEDPLSEYAMTIDEVERATGIDFFYQLPDEKETILESRLELRKWFR